MPFSWGIGSIPRTGHPNLGATACAQGFKGWQFDTYQAPTKQPQLTW